MNGQDIATANADLETFSRTVLGRRVRQAVFGFLLGGLSGCQLFVDDADREVYRLIEQRQSAALGETRDAGVGKERVPIDAGAGDYGFAPSPVTPEVPDELRKTTTQPTDLDDYAIPAEGEAPETQASATQPVNPEAVSMTLSEALLYAQQHSREFQTAKEDLFLSALDLSLERFLWTPQLMSTVSTQYANFGELRQFDDAMEAVADFAVQQRLPYGGDVTARVISTLMRDLNEHVTTGESAELILEANIPLLRGAGKVAYESRFQAERNLIYATREFEIFRRDFAVIIASDYFNLQQLQQNIANADAAYRQSHLLWLRARALAEEGRELELEESRAKTDERRALTTKIDAGESYGLALDQFKIRLGMPTTIQLELAEDDSDIHLQAPTASEKAAIETALRYRLDLLTVKDRIGDARRGVKNSANNLLPDFNFRAQMSSRSNPSKFRLAGSDYDRTTWRTFLDFEIPLNRQEERNQYRRSLILLRRTERAYSLFEDTVRLEVRRALRRIIQENLSLQVQDLTIVENERRRESAQIRFEQGLAPNRDILEAIDALRQARDRRAQSLARYQQTILEFQRDTGTLRIGDDGKWLEIEGAGS